MTRLLATAALYAIGANASQFLLVTLSGDDVWTLHAIESVSIGGKSKLRRVMSGGPPAISFDTKSIARIPSVEIDSFAIIRRGADGVLLGRTAQLPDWQLLLPDGVKSKTPQSAVEIWKQAAISVRTDRKDKANTEIPHEQFYALLPGTDPAALAATLATDPALHANPGIVAGDAFLRSISFLPSAVKAHPSGPSAERLREYLHSGLKVRLRDWSDGDAEVTVLHQAVAMAKASETAFSDDSEQRALRSEVLAASKKLERQLAILRALDAGGRSDAFLLAYRDFEIFDRSFTELKQARQTHLKKSALLHLETGVKRHKTGDYAAAIQHLRAAVWRDPSLTEADQLLERVRLEVARITSQRIAEQRRGIDPRSPTQVQLQRRLTLAEQYLRDQKFAEAEQALEAAEAVDKDEPKIRFLSAKLTSMRGDLGRSLALLDYYAGLAITEADFQQGERLRAEVLYKIENLRKSTATEASAHTSSGMFATAFESAAGALKVDNEDPRFLYHAGLNACVLRNCVQAVPLLKRFLDVTDSTQGKREQRLAAVRLLRYADSAQLNSKQNQTSNATSWFSGAPLEKGAFYDPVSLAFQAKIAKVEASKSLNVTYEWAGDRLKSVHTRYEDKKTATNVLKIASAAAAAAGGVGSTVGWRTADRETNEFYFNYYDDFPQVLNVSRDQTLVKSRSIPITIPGVGMFGGFGAVGGLGMLGNGMMRSTSLMGNGFGGLSGFSGVGGLGALRAYAASQTPSFSAGSLSAIGAEAARQFTRNDTFSIRPDPQGGNTSGAVTLWNSPRIDTRLAYLATGKRVAVGFSGNAFFHPFAWDALHLFELDYDDEGRIRKAREKDVPNAHELEFTWNGRRLMSIQSKAGGYLRTLHYNGDRLTHETISFNGKQSKIEYKYDKQGVLISAECDEDLSLDGRSRRVEFLRETIKAEGKRP